MLPRRNASGHFVLHTVVEDTSVFPKESTRCDLSKVEWFSRRNVLGSKKVGGTGSVEGRIISPKECNSPINIRMGDYNLAGAVVFMIDGDGEPTESWRVRSPP